MLSGAGSRLFAELQRPTRESPGLALEEGPAAAQQYAPSEAEQVLELQARIAALRRDNTLLLTQLARAVKCLNAVSSENQLLKTEVASLGHPGMAQDALRS